MSNRDYIDYIKVDSTRRNFVPEKLQTSRQDYSNLYKIYLKFSVVSPIHIGNGEKSFDSSSNKILLKMYNFKGIPRIPGSSLKGFVSTYYLGLTSNSILTSDLFGTTKNNAIISKVFFQDVVIESTSQIQKINVNRMFRPRKRKRGHIKFYVGKANPTPPLGLMETIPKNTILSTYIVGNGLKEYEIGGILMSCGLFKQKNNSIESKPIKIGYAKPQCYSKIKLIPSKIKIIKFEIDLLNISKSQISNVNLYLDKFSNFVAKYIPPNDSLNKRFNRLFRDEC
ncbi:MAG: RAMP superfamily CRISPR-associated protein [Candidatus Helarchaeota archaeon]